MKSLDEARYRVILLTTVPSTPHGFLRAVNRILALPMRAHLTDLFDQAQTHLAGGGGGDQAAHPVLVVDDAEGMSAENLDLLRRLTAYALDSEEVIESFMGPEGNPLFAPRFSADGKLIYAVLPQGAVIPFEVAAGASRRRWQASPKNSSTKIGSMRA